MKRRNFVFGIISGEIQSRDRRARIFSRELKDFQGLDEIKVTRRAIARQRSGRAKSEAHGAMRAN